MRAHSVHEQHHPLGLLAALRDEALFSNWGIKVLIRMPAKDGKIVSNNVDEYSNHVNTEWIDTKQAYVQAILSVATVIVALLVVGIPVGNMLF